jgi:integrase
MRPIKPPRPHKREGVWYLMRRVPKEYKHLDKRGLVKISTNIAVAADPRGVHARKVVAELNAVLEAYWRDLRDGEAADARVRFEAAQRRARALDLHYQTNAELAEGPLSEILKRIDLLSERGTLGDAGEVSAVMGGEECPTIKMSGLVAEYEALSEATNARKTPNQMRKWRNPRLLAMNQVIEAIGDRPLDQYTRADALKLRTWWQGRIVGEGIKIKTANKMIGHVAKMVKTVSEAHQLNLKPVFSDLRFEGGKDEQRIAFTPAFVQTRILAPGALDGLNEQARDLVYLITDTGLRLSEGVELDETTIFLNATVPFVRVSPLRRELKTHQSERDMPLVGNALAAMKRNPIGFPRYRDKADSLSALVNDYFKVHGLQETKEHTLYGLRHTFEDRLTAVEAPEKVIASLMGHKWSRPKYGLGPSLEQKQKWLLQIAFRTPQQATP